MISLNDIAKVYSNENATVHALKGISLDISEGEIFGILGKQGAGKSALIRCINLLEKPTSGSIVIDSHDLTKMDTQALRLARRKIGMIFKHFNLMSTRTIAGNIALPLEVNNLTKPQIDEKVNALLVQTDLMDKKNAYPYQLTTGEKQKVAIARALANDPKILLCENPTWNLDLKSTVSILQLLSDINKNLRTTIVLITHEIEVVKTICHRVAILNQGEIVEIGTPFKIFTEPKSETAKELIKKATRLDMPNALRKRLKTNPHSNTNPVLRISFVGQSAQEPLIAYVIQQFDLTVNITQAHMETFQEECIGIMVIEVMGEEENVEKAIQFLEHKGLHIEVLGYAPRIT